MICTCDGYRAKKSQHLLHMLFSKASEESSEKAWGRSTVKRAACFCSPAWFRQRGDGPVGEASGRIFSVL